MLRIVTGCAVLLGLTAFAAATPRIDCTVQEMYGAEHALVSLDDQIFEITLDLELAFSGHAFTPEGFCAIQDDDFVAFILPVPRLPEESPATPLPTIDGGMIEPWGAPDPFARRRGASGAQAAEPQTEPAQESPTVIVEDAPQSLAWGPSGADEPAPSPSRERAPLAAGSGCTAASAHGTAWWGVLALLALARRRRNR